MESSPRCSFLWAMGSQHIPPGALEAHPRVSHIAWHQASLSPWDWQGQGAILTPLRLCPRAAASRASAPPLATDPSRVAHVPPPHILPAPAQVPPCPPALSAWTGAEPQPPPFTLGCPFHCPCALPTPVTVWGQREGQCCPCGTHLLSQFPIWDRDIAPSCILLV